MLVVAVVALLFAAGACSDDRDALSLEEGQCFQEPDDERSVTDVEIVDCDEPHDNEVFHVETLEGDDVDFPGETEINEVASDSCHREITGFLGGSPTGIGVDVRALTPTEQSWSEGGDREIVCYVFTEGVEVLDESLGDAAREIQSFVEECEDGDNVACDRLYRSTPVDSPEEEIGATCGGRSEERLDGTCEATLG